ncbi:MAG: PEP-CTERM sorting domain-containing protein [Akkermansiaceae bacterium]|tara:strand:+ start:60 stop:857 length:798 start_codon:yes stop_codon:yes gene_type:complete
MKKQTPSNNKNLTLTIASILLGSVVSPCLGSLSIIDDGFGSGSIADAARFTESRADRGYYKDGNSNWGITGGVLANPGNGATAQNRENPVGKVVSISTAETNLTQVVVSFDYTVGAGATLFFHLAGYAIDDGTGNQLANTQDLNGNLQNQGETSYGDMNLLTGLDETGNASDTISFAAGTSGTFTQTYDLTAYSWVGEANFSGAISDIRDFDLVLAAFASNLTSTDGTGAISINDFSVEATAVPEPSSAALLGLGGLALILRRRK